MQAGVYRATSPVIPPSAAWGLVLNLAGVETRDRASEGAATPTLSDAPRLRLAIGTRRDSTTSTLYQQLHSYRVGKDAKTKALSGKTNGAKYWIAPVRREILVGFDAVVGVQAPAKLLERIPKGLAGGLQDPRYGLPFAGDNNLLFDQIAVVRSPPEAYWYVPASNDTSVPVQSSCRLTICIDRQDGSRTLTKLFMRTGRVALPPAAAWVETPGTAAES